jgi:hypothetical protein
MSNISDVFLREQVTFQWYDDVRSVEDQHS